MLTFSRWSSRALLAESLLSLSLVSCGGEPLDLGESPTQSSPPPEAMADTDSPPIDPMTVRPVDRLTASIDAEIRQVLTGHRHPLARAELEVGAAAPDQAMEKMMLVLQPDVTQARGLDALVRAQQDASSPLFHQWLTPADYGKRFGVSEADMSRILAWLRTHGMTVDEVTNGNRLVLFSGTVAGVEETFRTSMRAYRVDGELHIANATDPSIPGALAPVVSGVVSLHDFRSRASYAHREFSQAENTTYFNGIQQSALVPADLATIYNANPLYAASIDGTGQTIAVIGRSNIDVGNVRTFRSMYGLPAKDPTVVLGGTDPGIVCGGDEAEAYLDVEYAGALAKRATVKFVVAASTRASDGILLASAYAVNNKVAPIVSLSYGQCEKSLGTSGNSFFNSLWHQAVAQGMSVMVASMDSGAAGCDAMEAATATGGLAVNGIGSTPFNTAVGGTQFDDVYNRSQYWAASNDPITQASARGYIPELVWNESRGGGLYASGGGLSTLYPKPSWQFGLGVLADGKRGVPDVSFAAAIQDPYRMYADNQPFGGGGTSAATPVFASIMALVLQKVGQPQGLVNPILYGLAYNQTNSGGATVFHDVTKGDNTVPGVTGYTAGPGYDLATGLGSVDATQLVNHWQEGKTLPDFLIVATSPSASILSAATTTTGYAVKANNGFTGAVALSISGLPAGVTAQFAPAQVTGSGASTLTLTAAATVAAGSYTLTVSAKNSSTTRSVPLSLTVVVAPPLALGISASYLDIAAGASASATITTTRSSAFNSTVALTVSGLPQGITATLSATSIKAPGAGTSTLTVKMGSTVAGGSYLATIIASGGGITKVAYLTVNALPAPSFSLTLNPTTVTGTPGATVNTVANTIRTTTFNSSVSLKVTGMPAGVTASSGSIAAPGSGISTLGISVGGTAAPGTYTLTVTATGGGVTKTAELTLNVSGIKLSAAATSVSVKKGSTATVSLTTASLGGFSSQVAFAVTGLPAGVTATFSPAVLAAPGSGSTTMKFSASTTAAAGTYQVTVNASAGATVKTQVVTLTVKS